MTATATPGTRCYLEDGREAEYVSAVGARHAVRVILLDEEDGAEFASDDLTIVSRVFAAPPAEKWHDEIKRLRAEHDEVAKAVSDLHRRLYAEEERAKSHAGRKALARHAAVATVIDFLDGKITHFVVAGYGSVAIKEVATMFATSQDYDKRVRLTAERGRRGEALEWSVASYYHDDGRSNSAEIVIPCRSLDEARDEARKLLDTFFRDANGPHAAAAYSATVLGFPVPVSVLERVTAEKRARAAQDVKRAEAELARVKATLAEVTP